MMRMMRLARVMALAGMAVAALAGCASLDEGRMARLWQAQQDTRLRKVASAAELDALVRRSGELEQLRESLELRRLCREHRKGPNRPWACDRHRRTDGEATTLDRIEVTGSRIRPSDLITRNQEAGVDEGDIVKKSGDFILVLRNGVLHSVRIGRNGRPVLEHADWVTVATDPSGEGAWYDEILTFGDRVILLGFNYGVEQEVAELLLFTLDDRGRLHRDGRYWLRTQDYFQPNNYGARIQGGNLLLSMSLKLDLQGEMAWPEWSRRDGGHTGWTPLIDIGELYFPIYTTSRPYLHVLLQCPIAALGGTGLDCRTTGIIGAGDSVLYASDRAAYLALPAWDEAAFLDSGFREWRSLEPAYEHLRRTAVYRIPFAEHGVPAFALIDGRVDDPMRFKETPDGLHVAGSDGPVDAPGLVLTRIDGASFRTSRDTVIRPVAVLPLGEGQDTIRFADTSVWVGTHRYALEGEDSLQHSRVLVQPLDGGTPWSLTVPHSADRLEPAFGGMIIAGTSGAPPWVEPAKALWSLSFASERSPPRLHSTVAVPQHLSAEERSHAFNLGELSSGVRLFGLPGWPMSAPDRARDGEVVSDLVFMRLAGEQIHPAGVMSMQDAPTPQECEHSCYDWYGNARLFFVGDRVFALSANLFKEAAYRAGAVHEVRRVVLP